MFHSPKVGSFKMDDYPWTPVIPNKGIMINCKNDLIYIGLLDMIRIGYFGL